ncbi:MAG: DUF1501 domain-containing protein [Planctomycetota bacterium]|nr:MAG: DUF1501 domain-containing protein [Planctomycetota bacterium]REJ89087.1 MAG: DUF1501 domain-containing protein [Planctomycetota bacterium]REK24645.1 MAG: DUF1501 domain-containing protein [Planctomycetota bacterium]REK40144.1 MAG: DUF1501 domain-containing protein [Planctomycetota bacterium]
MTRRHFTEHLMGAAAMAIPAMTFTRSLRANAAELKKNERSCILLWMSGGPATIDIWDLKPGSVNGGPFQPIATTGEGQISEHMPQTAQLMKHLSIVRSMSTREADHGRGRYYMHTGYVPNPTIDHPSYGSVVAQQLGDQRESLEIPPFVAIGGSSVGPGFLGMSYAPFVVNSQGRIQDLKLGIEASRAASRMQLLNALEKRFIEEDRGLAASEHAKVLRKTQDLMTSKQMDAFRVEQEPAEVRERYGNTNFGRGCLMARRLVEVGVPFVEVDFGGWDTHSNNFATLQNNRLPQLDQGMSALVADLEQRGMLGNTAILWMGEFGRTPNINGNTGRDHWARSWSVVAGGAGFAGGKVIGETNADGTAVETEPYTSEDLLATTLSALGISLDSRFTSRSGRPMKIANGGRLIKGLLANA